MCLTLIAYVVVQGCKILMSWATPAKVYGSLLLLFSTLTRPPPSVSMQVQSHFSFQSPFVLFVVMPKQPPSAAAAVCRHSFSVSPQRQALMLYQEV